MVFYFCDGVRMQIQDEEKDSIIMVFETLTTLGPGIQDEDKDSMIMMMVMLVFESLTTLGPWQRFQEAPHSSTTF